MSSCLLRTVTLLTLSNLSMPCAWYGHPREMSGQPWAIAAILSYGVHAIPSHLKKQPVKLVSLWTGLCIMGALYGTSAR